GARVECGRIAGYTGLQEPAIAAHLADIVGVAVDHGLSAASAPRTPPVGPGRPCAGAVVETVVEHQPIGVNRAGCEHHAGEKQKHRGGRGAPAGPCSASLWSK